MDLHAINMIVVAPSKTTGVALVRICDGNEALICVALGTELFASFLRARARAASLPRCFEF